MRDPRQVVLRPLVTEKATTLKDERNQVSFQVAVDANKIDIRRAVEAIFNVKVTDVRTQVVFGKEKRMGRFVGRRASWKKAVVQLAHHRLVEERPVDRRAEDGRIEIERAARLPARVDDVDPHRA